MGRNALSPIAPCVRDRRMWRNASLIAPYVLPVHSSFPRERESSAFAFRLEPNRAKSLDSRFRGNDEQKPKLLAPSAALFAPSASEARLPPGHSLSLSAPLPAVRLAP